MGMRLYLCIAIPQHGEGEEFEITGDVPEEFKNYVYERECSILDLERIVNDMGYTWDDVDSWELWEGNITFEFRDGTKVKVPKEIVKKYEVKKFVRYIKGRVVGYYSYSYFDDEFRIKMNFFILKGLKDFYWRPEEMKKCRRIINTKEFDRIVEKFKELRRKGKQAFVVCSI